ncbi:hypothetical protein C8R44DRAFT_725869 [Mycena epipterygia]|nr:hypothetical protein C8R44DRAFT_725869 [Mycena epipterygia]
MQVTFTRFGTLFCGIFSSLWFKARFIFGSRIEASRSDMETIIELADLNGTSNVPEAAQSHDTGASTEPITAQHSVAFSAFDIASPLFRPPKYLSLRPADRASNNENDDSEALGIPFKCAESTVLPRGPFKSIVNTYEQPIANVHLPRRSHAQTLKRVHPCPDLRSPSPPYVSRSSPSTIAGPGSIGWHSDKLNLLEETRARNTRVKTASDARRCSLPLPTIAKCFASDVRRVSAPANLGRTRPSVEERLQRAVSGGHKVTPPLVPGEPQFIIDEDEDVYLKDDTYVAAPAFPCRAPRLLVRHAPSSHVNHRSSRTWNPSRHWRRVSSCDSAGSLMEVIALEAMFSTSRWLSLVDLEGAAVRKEERQKSTGGCAA